MQISDHNPIVLVTNVAFRKIRSFFIWAYLLKNKNLPPENCSGVRLCFFENIITWWWGKHTPTVVHPLLLFP